MTFRIKGFELSTYLPCTFFGVEAGVVFIVVVVLGGEIRTNCVRARANHSRSGMSPRARRQVGSDHHHYSLPFVALVSDAD